MQFKETSEEMKQTGDQVTIERLLPLATLAPGKYSLEVSATDTLSNQTISRSAEFTVKAPAETKTAARSEEHTSELQSHLNLVCRLLLEKKNKKESASRYN